VPDALDLFTVECQICNRRYRNLTHHLRRGHGLDPEEYMRRYRAPLISPLERRRIALQTDRIWTPVARAAFMILTRWFWRTDDSGRRALIAWIKDQVDSTTWAELTALVDRRNPGS